MVLGRRAPGAERTNFEVSNSSRPHPPYYNAQPESSDLHRRFLETETTNSKPDISNLTKTSGTSPNRTSVKSAGSLSSWTFKPISKAPQDASLLSTPVRPRHRSSPTGLSDHPPTPPRVMNATDEMNIPSMTGLRKSLSSARLSSMRFLSNNWPERSSVPTAPNLQVEQENSSLKGNMELKNESSSSPTSLAVASSVASSNRVPMKLKSEIVKSLECRQTSPSPRIRSFRERRGSLDKPTKFEHEHFGVQPQKPRSPLPDSVLCASHRPIRAGGVASTVSSSIANTSTGSDSAAATVDSLDRLQPRRPSLGRSQSFGIHRPLQQSHHQTAYQTPEPLVTPQPPPRRPSGQSMKRVSSVDCLTSLGTAGPSASSLRAKDHFVMPSLEYQSDIGRIPLTRSKSLTSPRNPMVSCTPLGTTRRGMSASPGPGPVNGTASLRQNSRQKLRQSSLQSSHFALEGLNRSTSRSSILTDSTYGGDIIDFVESDFVQTAENFPTGDHDSVCFEVESNVPHVVRYRPLPSSKDSSFLPSPEEV